MNNRWCSACGKEFRPCPKAPKQSYCSEPGCQRERRRLWQQAKRRSDPDYLDNQARAQQAWCQRNPDYWRAYRTAHPVYTERNRELQRLRQGLAIAKMDSFTPPLSLGTGVYQLRPLDNIGIAKMYALTVQITVIGHETFA